MILFIFWEFQTMVLSLRIVIQFWSHLRGSFNLARNWSKIRSAHTVVSLASTRPGGSIVVLQTFRLLIWMWFHIFRGRKKKLLVQCGRRDEQLNSRIERASALHNILIIPALRFTDCLLRNCNIVHAAQYLWLPQMFIGQSDHWPQRCVSSLLQCFDCDDVFSWRFAVFHIF